MKIIPNLAHYHIEAYALELFNPYKYTLQFDIVVPRRDIGHLISANSGIIADNGSS
jgi:hypothetical protein